MFFVVLNPAITKLDGTVNPAHCQSAYAPPERDLNLVPPNSGRNVEVMLFDKNRLGLVYVHLHLTRSRLFIAGATNRVCGQVSFREDWIKS